MNSSGPIDKGPIVTGQQIGLLSGPMYVPYKVLGAVWTARKEGRKAVYWLETNDADFQEISSLVYFHRDGNLRRLRWEKRTGGLSCGNIAVDAQLVELLNTFFGELPQTEFTPGLRELALDIFRVGRELGEAAKELAGVLFPFPELELFDPRNERFRTFCRGILLPLFERTPPQGQCPGFVDDHGVRRAVFRNESGYRLRDGRSLDIQDYPLLPNVETRPLCQDAWFATSAAIVGPGEMAYLEPLAGLYRECGIRQPRLILRMSLTLAEPWTRRQLAKLGLDVESLLKYGCEPVRQLLLKESGESAFREIKSSCEDSTRRFLQELISIHPDFSVLRNPLEEEVKRQLGQIRRKNRERNAQKTEVLGKLMSRLQPYDRPQERTMNPFYYMNLYGGTALMGTLLEGYDPEKTLLELS